MNAASAPQTTARCFRHPRYFLASCEHCRAAQRVRIVEIRERLLQPA